MRPAFALLLAVFSIAIGIRPAQAITLSPVATGYVENSGLTISWTGVVPLGGYENYPYQPRTSSYYSASPAGERLELLGVAGYSRYTPPYHTEFSWYTRYGWAAFQIPEIDPTLVLSAAFTATYTNGEAVSLTDLSPTSFGSAENLFNDVKSTPYARVPAGSWSPRTVTTWLGGTIGDDIWARRGDIFYIGLMGPCCASWQPTVYLDNMSLSVHVSSVPLPASAWFFATAILGMFAWKTARGRQWPMLSARALA